MQLRIEVTDCPDDQALFVEAAERLLQQWDAGQNDKDPDVSEGEREFMRELRRVLEAREAVAERVKQFEAELSHKLQFHRLSPPDAREIELVRA